MGKVTILVISLLLLLGSCAVSKVERREITSVRNQQDSVALLINTDSLRAFEKDYMRRNPYGNWEMYIAGEPEELGSKMGRLSQDLYKRQQEILVDKLFEMVPSESKRRWIMRFVRWYNRKLDNYIPKPYLREIAALSNYLGDDFDYLGTPFERTLWMHGAHDIGHALQDLAMVGCSSFAVWNERSADGKLLIGRNLDFYMNDAFAEQKMVYFVKPSEGIPYMSVSWPGMVGVLSGMNANGLTVTLNAGKSSIPLAAKTPISLVARSILQYASNIEEAVAIARKQQVFVSESLLIGSAHDRKAVLVELSPKRIDVVEAETDQILCTNHFQGKAYENDRRNRKQMLESHSVYRYEKLQTLLQGHPKMTPKDVAKILRNRDGLERQSIGLGNDRSLNHLLAHHGIIFQPEDRRVYVSNNPGQMGTFVAYDLREIFGDDWAAHRSYGIDSLRIEADPFVYSKAYGDYKLFKEQTEQYKAMFHNKERIVTLAELESYVALNPDLWLGYYVAGRILYLHGDYKNASIYFEKSLDKEIPTTKAEEDVQHYLKKAQERWNKRQ